MIDTVSDIDLTRALPLTLKNDEKILALGRVIAAELQSNIRLSRLNIIYPRIDELDEALLDILAYDLHIDWYDPDSSPNVKRAIIKESVRVHKRLGTKYAVESVVSAYFGSGEVREWYEYGGEPHHFKIISDNPSVTGEQAARFFAMLEVVKRKSSWLDSILITLTGESNLFLGVVFHEHTREARLIAPKDFIDQLLTVNLAQVHAERTAESHVMGKKDSLNLYFKALPIQRTHEQTVFGDGGINLSFGTMRYERTAERHTITEEE